MLQNSFLQHLLLVFDKGIKCKALRWRLKGAYLKYVTKAECREQRSSLPFIKHPIFYPLNFQPPIYTWEAEHPK